MFRKILCPVDLTTWTRAQLTYAKNFARFQCADIHKVRLHRHIALQPSSLPTQGYRASSSPQVESSSIVQTTLISDPVRTAHELHRIAIEKHFDLIIMPVNLKSDFNEIQCESVFQEVFSSSAIPILAVPKKTSFKLPKRILCVVDVNQVPSKISHLMPQLANEAHARYFVMNSFEPEEKTHESNQYIMLKAEEILNYIFQEVSYALGADEITVRIGHASDAILGQIEDQKIDMLLMGFSYFKSDSVQSALRLISQLSIPALCVPETNGSVYTIH
jgi:hypothetical protein